MKGAGSREEVMDGEWCNAAIACSLTVPEQGLGWTIEGAFGEWAREVCLLRSPRQEERSFVLGTDGRGDRARLCARLLRG